MMRPINLNDYRAELEMAVKIWRALVDAKSPVSVELLRLIDLAEKREEFTPESEETAELYLYALKFEKLVCEEPIYDTELKGLICEAVEDTIETVLLESTTAAIEALEADIIDAPSGRIKTRLDQLTQRVHELEAELWAIKNADRISAMKNRQAAFEAEAAAAQEADKQKSVG